MRALAVVGAAAVVTTAVLARLLLDTRVPGTRAGVQLVSPLPSGQPIATAISREGRWDVYLFLDRGARIVRLTDSGTATGGAEVSPDGRRVVFSDEREGTNDLYVGTISSTGRLAHLRRITSAPCEEQGPHWSPDGSEIVYQHWCNGIVDIETVRPDGTNVSKLTHDEHSWAPSWTPNGDSIVFIRSNGDTGGADVWVMDADGRHQHVLVNFGGYLGRPIWSDDGTIAFSSNSADGRRHVWLADADGHDVHQLTQCACDETTFAWFGRDLLFVSKRDGTDGVGL